MAEKSHAEKQALVKEFQSKKDHAERCEFLHAEGNEYLLTIFSVIHYPKPEKKQ